MWDALGILIVAVERIRELEAEKGKLLDEKEKLMDEKVERAERGKEANEDAFVGVVGQFQKLKAKAGEIRERRESEKESKEDIP
jgi:hypothetical protein